MSANSLTPTELWRKKRGSTIRNLLRLAYFNRRGIGYVDGQRRRFAQMALLQVRATRP